MGSRPPNQESGKSPFQCIQRASERKTYTHTHTRTHTHTHTYIHTEKKEEKRRRERERREKREREREKREERRGGKGKTKDLIFAAKPLKSAHHKMQDARIFTHQHFGHIQLAGIY